MFKNLFKKKTDLELLNEKYQKLMKEAHRLSVVNRTKSDEMIAEAEKLGKLIDSITNNK
ncbi:MAG: Lacal_2735 family protein [Bacteroidota bacterium]|nr:Lacal_2735 family protein [Bacteroidota bacterium]